MPFGFGKGRGRGSRGKGIGFRGRGGPGPASPPKNCICPQCGQLVPHKLGVPCFRTKCPQCGSPMTRQFFE